MLQGSLDNFALDEVLSLLATTNKTGRLAISGDRGTGSLWLDTGSVVGAGASNLEDQTPVDDVMFELLRFETGSFLFTMNERLDAPGVAEDIDALLDGAQDRITEWRTIESVVPSLDHELWLTRSLNEDEVLLSRRDWDIVVAVGEGNTVGTVCAAVDLGEVDGSREIKGLIQRGVLTISEAPAVAPTATPAAEAAAAAAPSHQTPAFQAVTTEHTFAASAEVATAGFIDSGDVAGFAAPVAAEPVFQAPAPAATSHAEFAFLDEQAAQEFAPPAAETPVVPHSQQGPVASFGAGLESETLNAPLSSEDPGAGLHDLFSVDDDDDLAGSHSAPSFEPAPSFDAAPAFEPAPSFDAAPAFEPAPVFEAAPAFDPAPAFEPAPVFEAAPAVEPAHAEFALDNGRPPMPPPPTIGPDGSIQPPASLAGIAAEDDDEASLLMRYLKSDNHN